MWQKGSECQVDTIPFLQDMGRVYTAKLLATLT